MTSIGADTQGPGSVISSADITPSMDVCAKGHGRRAPSSSAADPHPIPPSPWKPGSEVGKTHGKDDLQANWRGFLPHQGC
ncbi:hypothetical protein Y1Q_0016408 [Alligator mississippiensis]|nr:hypothetical protein Y1Q_0016408 [Alligator mississippiensis]